MNSHSFRRFVWIFLVILSGSIDWGLSETQDTSECVSSVHTAVSRKLFENVGEELMKENENTGKGFVYSPLKFVHKLTVLYGLESSWPQYYIMQYLGLHNTCKVKIVCRTFDDIIKGMNDRLPYQKFYFESQILYQIDHEVKDLGGCASKNEFDFIRSPETVLKEIVQRYKKECKTDSTYLDHNLDSRSRFFLLDVLRLTPKVFGFIERLESTEQFQDMDGVMKEIPWLKMTGEFWIGARLQTGNKCNHILLYSSEIGEKKLNMLYFRPVFDNYNRNELNSCIKEILSNLGEYIKRAIDESSDDPQSFMTGSIAVPVIDQGTDVDLKPILGDTIKKIFDEGQIHGITHASMGQTLHEIREWDYFNNKPENYDEIAPEKDPDATVFLSSPFVYTVVDKQSRIVLKTGVFLRPETK